MALILRGILLALAFALGVAASSDDQPNMNGPQGYILSQTPGAKDTQAKFPTHFHDYPRPVESFDIYSPLISQLYSQVFWKGLPPVDLPADVVQRYAGKGMAIVGFEMDQVRKTPQGDIPVPLTVVYNHHFESNLVGAKSRLEQVPITGPDDPKVAELGLANGYGHGGHGLPDYSEGLWAVRDLAPDNDIPTSTSLGGANGGEYRGSFHGYAPGYAQVIDSPTKFQITPMQIDTWNRDEMNLTVGLPFVSGPVPRNSWAPKTGPDALYSGLLECPVTTRVRKVVDEGYESLLSGTCAESIETATECFAAAQSIFGSPGGSASQTSTSSSSLSSSNASSSGPHFANKAGSDPSKPAGCSAAADAADASLIHVFFNTNSHEASTSPSSVACGASSSGSSSSTGSSSSSNATLVGVASSLVDVAVRLDTVAQVAHINLTGPADVWFGVGFNATYMKAAPWAIIVEATGGSGGAGFKVSERKLQDQSPGSALAASVTVVSSTVDGKAGTRTVVLTRPLKGKTGDYYTFDPAASGTQLPLINAVGTGPALAYHKSKSPTRLSLLPETGGACVCAAKKIPFGAAKGSLVYQPTAQKEDVGSGTVGFPNKCAPEPRTDLLAQQNPTCDVRTYLGGQSACHHMWSLLDADQPIPWPDQPLEYHLKFRFWVQPYNASYHTNLKRTTWGIASPVEYDVPKCGAGVPGCSRAADGVNWIHTIRGTFTGGGKLSAAHFHCHAPTCLSIAMYACDPKVVKSAADCNATTGKLLCEEKPVYGGTGNPLVNPKQNEPGYILQPPCLWGDEEFGLEAPPDTTGMILHSVKTSNATYGHHGEMAWQQMYYF